MALNDIKQQLIDASPAELEAMMRALHTMYPEISHGIVNDIIAHEISHHQPDMPAQKAA